MNDKGFNGTIKEFLQHLREDPSNSFSTSEEMLQKYREIVDESHNKIKDILTRVPGAKVE